MTVTVRMSEQVNEWESKTVVRTKVIGAVTVRMSGQVNGWTSKTVVRTKRDRSLSE